MSNHCNLLVTEPFLCVAATVCTECMRLLCTGEPLARSCTVTATIIGWTEYHNQWHYYWCETLQYQQYPDHCGIRCSCTRTCSWHTTKYTFQHQNYTNKNLSSLIISLIAHIQNIFVKRCCNIPSAAITLFFRGLTAVAFSSPQYCCHVHATSCASYRYSIGIQ